MKCKFCDKGQEFGVVLQFPDDAGQIWAHTGCFTEYITRDDDSCGGIDIDMGDYPRLKLVVDKADGRYDGRVIKSEDGTIELMTITALVKKYNELVDAINEFERTT